MAIKQNLKKKTQQKKLEPINAIPSKELFIDMLTKDLTIKDVIGDLVDNSVDAANRNKANKSDLSNFWIHINIDKNRFEIIDNAGGIEVDVAKKSAFKLGKPKNYKLGSHTIGQFGIGMKRAFFKLGENIKVESVALKSGFTLPINVPIWKAKRDEKDWDFDFENENKTKHDLKDTRTKILVTNLKEDVKKQFAEGKFINDLKNEISIEHLFAIKNGLIIKINGEKLIAKKITLIYNKDFRPCFWSYKSSNGLKAEILTGISEDKGEEGGWYIFCNDRLILGPDTTELTGWKGGRGKGGKEGKELPKYHDQYFRFRGYVFFNSENSSKLPWTTSKTGIDKDSPDFSFIRTKMIELAKQVKSLMDDLKTEREKNNPIVNRRLNNIVETASKTSVVEVTTILKHKNKLTSTFKYPKRLFNPIIIQNKTETKITFFKPTKKIEKVMEYFAINSSNEAGSKSFDYFYDKHFSK